MSVLMVPVLARDVAAGIKAARAARNPGSIKATAATQTAAAKTRCWEAYLPLGAFMGMRSATVS
jgi:hypothetical protein